MKHYLFLIMLAAASMIAACGRKGNNPAPDNNNNGGSTPPTNGGGQTSNTTGNTTNYNGYIVKTIGISKIRMATDKNDKLTVAEFVGGGNHIVVRAGTGNTMAFFNKNDFKPSIDPRADATRDVNYFAVNAPIDNGKLLDTSLAVTIKLIGFDRAKDGYNQLNLVLYQDVSIPQAGVITNNVEFMWMENFNDRSSYNNAFFTTLFTTPIKVSSVDLAKPLSENPYIVRDLVSDGVQLIYNGNTPSSFINFFNDIGIGMLKMGTNSSNYLQAGNLKTELVNSDKGQYQYVTYYDSFSAKNYYYPTFSNMVASSHVTVAEPADSTKNVFIRVSGFDVAKCGFNQLRIYLMQDPVNADIQPLQLINQAPLDKPTLESVKAALKTSGLYCYQLIPY